MPIITTPGQQLPPVPAQAPVVTLPSRLQSAFSPSPVRPISPIVPVKPVVAPLPPEEDDFDADDDADSGFATPTSAMPHAKTGLSLSRMSEEERRKTISSVFMLVLNKNPTDRDFSYYRFSTLTEDGLVKSLLNLPEHKKLMERAHEHSSLKQSVNDLDLQVKQLTASTDSMKQELVTMQQLLTEKNRYIQQMRGVPDSQGNQNSLPQQEPSSSNQAKPTLPVNVSLSAKTIETRKLPGPFDELKNMFAGIFKGK